MAVTSMEITMKKKAKAATATLLGVVLALVVVGCAARTESLDAVAAEIEGVYQLESHTQNLEDCEHPGKPAVSQDGGYLLAMQKTYVGEPHLEVFDCADVEDCLEKSRVGVSSYRIGFTFGKVDRQRRLAGQTVTTGRVSSDDDLCREGTIVDYVLESLPDGRIRIEERTTVADDHPKDAKGTCSTKATRAAAKGKSCSRLATFEATQVAGLSDT
jgi:hypothetical protein